MSGRSSVLAEQRDTTHSKHYHGNSLGSLDWKTVQNHTGVLHTEGEELEITKKEMCKIPQLQTSVIRIRYKCCVNLASAPVVGYDGQYPE